ncbi:hypothetical protein [Aquirufa aurantiipilula]
MKYFILSLILVILIQFDIVAKYEAYYPNGKKVPFKWETIRSLEKSLKLDLNNVKSYYANDGGAIFKKFTNIPLVYWFNDSKGIGQISKIQNLYNIEYANYIYSSSYYLDLNQMIENGLLTKSFIEDTFGNPTDTINYSETEKELTFHKYNLTLKFLDGNAVSASVYNFNAVERNKLSIVGLRRILDGENTNLEISFINSSNKDIKYIYIDIIVKNAVKDIIANKTLTVEGPIEANRPSDIMTFENIAYSKRARFLEISRMRVVYMDRTTRNLSKRDVENITFHNWEQELSE